jgi:hypothetical protein
MTAWLDRLPVFIDVVPYRQYRGIALPPPVECFSFAPSHLHPIVPPLFLSCPSPTSASRPALPVVHRQSPAPVPPPPPPLNLSPQFDRTQKAPVIDVWIFLHTSKFRSSSSQLHRHQGANFFFKISAHKIKLKKITLYI